MSASLKIFEGFLWHRYFDLAVPYLPQPPPKFLWHKTKKSDADFQHRPRLQEGPGSWRWLRWEVGFLDLESIKRYVGGLQRIVADSHPFLLHTGLFNFLNWDSLY